MNRDAAPPRIAVSLCRVAVVLAIATAVALLATQIMLAPPGRDLRDLGIYLATSGAISVALGWLLVRTLERRTRLSLLARFVVVTLVGSAVLVVNILVLARLMFISTDHDLQVLLATAAFSAIVAVSFTTWAASGTIARIARVNDGIRALADGNLGTRITVSGNDEITELARDVNALAHRLAEAQSERDALDQERRELTAAISHDLRTPLSTIRAMVDALEDGIVSEPSEVKRYFVTMRRDIERLSRMIDDLFELAQIDAGAMRLHRQQVTVHEIVSEVVDAMQARAERSGIVMELSVHAAPPPALLDGDRIERAISNLLSNALEHTPPGGAVHVSVNSTGGNAVVEVSDTGEGIADEDLSQIWTRFYRAERSRARAGATSDGAGLGLAITKGIVELHGGSVGVRSQRGAGSSFTMLIPLA